MKVYISKSNQANPDDLINLRELLKEDTVLEYRGGPYNVISLMDGIEQFYMIPPAQEFKGSFHIGKGIYAELNHAFDHLKVPCFIFFNERLYPVLSYKIIGIDWQANFTEVLVNISKNIQEQTIHEEMEPPN